MATITYDGQSLLIDGRRIFIVCGSVDYFRTPRGLWAERLRAAKEAGLNTILVRCPWSIHEPRKGEYVFDGEAEVAAFLQMIQGLGMRCILRPGPFIGSDVDLGGMPSWLLAEPNIALREGNPPFLEATSRYFGALFKALSPFSAASGGPIVAVQCEHEWYCGNEAAAQAYLLEIARFIREHGFDLPLINTNNLWQRREETIDTWAGRDDMLAHLRQLRTIHPRAPLMVGDFWIGEVDVWGRQRKSQASPQSMLWRLAQVLAAGGQFNISPFHGGTNFGFMGARMVGATDAYATTSADAQAPLNEAGMRTSLYRAVRRLCTFASSFERLFAAIDPDQRFAVTAMDALSDSSKRGGPSTSVVHLKGSYGDVVFVFGDENGKTQSTSILLPDGSSLPVKLGDQSVAWLLMNTHIGGRARLDWTNLSVLASNGRGMIVVFGAAGSTGLVSVNYGLIEIEVPTTEIPAIVKHEDLTLVVCNGESIDSVYLRDNTVHIGIDGFDASGEPIPAAGWKNRFEVNDAGEVAKHANITIQRRPPAIVLGEWTAANMNEYIDGTAPRFATIDGPCTQESCSAGSGYGFIRVTLPKGTGKKVKALSPGLGDRVHFYVKGQLKVLAGYGPGATESAFDLSLPSSKTSIVALVDNLGRFGGGNDMNEGKGIILPLYDVAVVRTGRVSIEDGPPRRPFELRQYIECMHGGELTSGRDLVWRFNYRKKSPLILEIAHSLFPAIAVFNDHPLGFYSGRTGRPTMCIRIPDEHVKRGGNELRIAPIEPADNTDLAGAVKVYEAKSEITANAAWAFGKWEPPKDNLFAPLDRKLAASLVGKPAWFRTSFSTRDTERAAWLEVTGLTKGQIYVNGYNIGRYFVADPAGKPIPPQKRFYLPAPWLKNDEANDLLIFDEHGHDPSKVKITFHDDAFA